MSRGNVPAVAGISADLLSLAVPIDSVTLHPRNPREGDVGAIVESLRRFGQLKPIVVQASTRFVVAGNHLLRAARELGWTEVAANVSDLDDRQARAFMVADNRTQELGTYDQDALGLLLRELAIADDLEGTGYDGDDVDAMFREFAPSVLDPEPLDEADTRVAVGWYRWDVERTAYEEWLESVKMDVGFADEDVISELHRRIGL